MNRYHNIDGVLTDGFLTVLRNLGLNDWHQWNPVLTLGLAWLLLIAWVMYLRTRIRYSIGPNHLNILLLGIPIRRVRLDNIRHIHGRKTKFAERWGNMVLTRYDRVLVIEKHRGLIKRCLITPDKRYVFKAELERAMQARAAARHVAPEAILPKTSTVFVDLDFAEKRTAVASSAGR
jgi:hypothetical protein